MVEEKVEINKLIKVFAKELKKEIPVEEIILFGSYVSGKFRKDSDIDLIVVSPSFAKKKYIINMQYLFRKAAAIDSHLEPIPATPEEIKYADRRTFLGQIKRTGRVIKVS